MITRTVAICCWHQAVLLLWRPGPVPNEATADINMIPPHTHARGGGCHPPSPPNKLSLSHTHTYTHTHIHTHARTHGRTHTHTNTHTHTHTTTTTTTVNKTNMFEKMPVLVHLKSYLSFHSLTTKQTRAKSVKTDSCTTTTEKATISTKLKKQYKSYNRPDNPHRQHT